MAIQVDYDCIVVGAGAGGLIVATLLAEAGRRVLLVERGPHLSYTINGRRDHLRNQVLSTYGHIAGPDIDGHPRVLVDRDGNERQLKPHELGYQNNAAVVGGGTVVYGAQAWRFLPADFEMATRYGVPAGSSLVDWPFSYETLAPYYERAEWEIGVAGPVDAHSRWPRERGYPMPPVRRGRPGTVMQQGAEALGLATTTPPLLINTIPRDGRPACIGCGSCIGFPCPTDSKNGTHNTMLPRAVATGLCDVLPSATVVSVDTDSRGKVAGVTIVEESDGEYSTCVLTAKAVVLSAGAIETARLLLMSRSKRHPEGLGNVHGLVGRNLQGHLYPTAYGRFDDITYDPEGPGVSIATTDFNHGNDGIVGGGMLADDFIQLPISFWKAARPPGVPRWGRAAKDFMREGYRRVIAIRGPVHEIPQPNSQVTLAPHVRDKFGLPVAQLSGVVHEETLRTARYMYGKARKWLEAAGASEIWGAEPQYRLSAGQHQAGTCRMGDDPRTSVTDQWGRVWGHDNLFVADASLHPTNGGFNPVLTIMALAFRIGEHVAANI